MPQQLPVKDIQMLQDIGESTGELKLIVVIKGKDMKIGVFIEIIT